jgi:hypothetical protein
VVAQHEGNGKANIRVLDSVSCYSNRQLLKQGGCTTQEKWKSKHKGAGLAGVAFICLEVYGVTVKRYIN